MDSLLSAGKKFAEQQMNKDDNQNQQQQHVQGGSQWNDSAVPFGNGSNLDFNAVKDHAKNDHGDDDNGLFDNVLSFVSQKQSDKEDVDEDKLAQNHKAAYEGRSQMDASSLGSAAAMQALKRFTSGGTNDSQSDKGGFQSKLIGMAMSEAVKLFNKNGASNGSKEDAASSAAQTMMKLLIKNKVSGSTGGSDSGGLGQLAGLAGKFLNK